jgi:protein involved in polysaccharide export with SLBB domain
MANKRLALLLLLLASCGCASLTNPVADAIPVREVPDELLAPSRNDEVTIPLNQLSLPADTVYRVAPGDVLGIWIEGILGATNLPPPLHISTTPLPRDQRRVAPAVGYPIAVEPDGTIALPMIDPLPVTGLTLADIQKALKVEYAVKRKLLKAGHESILVSLLQPRQIRVLVLRQESSSFSATTEGNVVPAGKRGTGQIVELAAHENDVLHALTLSGGLPGVDAYNKVIIFRNAFQSEVRAKALLHNFQEQGRPVLAAAPIAAIPLRMKCGQPLAIPPEAIALQEGDVIFVEARDRELFYTGGLLPSGEHILPRDHNLDVLEAIARIRGPILNGAFGTNNLAGNLVAPGLGGPSPSMLIVVRRTPGGNQVPIRVDLNRALLDARERLVIQPGDLLLLQEHPNEALARYFSTTFFNFTYSWQAIRSATGLGVLDVNSPQNVPARVGYEFLRQ